jgi:hypothetical protein
MAKRTGRGKAAHIISCGSEHGSMTGVEGLQVAVGCEFTDRSCEGRMLAHRLFRVRIEIDFYRRRRDQCWDRDRGDTPRYTRLIITLSTVHAREHQARTVSDRWAETHPTHAPILNFALILGISSGPARWRSPNPDPHPSH